MESSYYSQLSWFRQERVATASVMVVGCGALGNEVLKNLVLFGIRRLVLVDFDSVEFSNLTRSVFYRPGDVGRPKVEVMAERLRAINPDVEVLPVCGDIAYDVGLGMVRRVDVIIGCVDSRWARYIINRLAMRAGKPWVDGGIDGLEGTARVFMPDKNCYACNLGTEGRQELKHRLSCANTIRRNEEARRVATTPVVASVIGAVEVQEAMKLLHRDEVESGELTSLCGRMFYYDGQHLTTKTVAFEAYDDECAEHELWADITSSNLTTELTVGEALRELRLMLRTNDVSIVLLNNCFVDYIEDRDTNLQTRVMCARHLVADRIAHDERLRGLPDSRFYQHEYHRLDAAFPYPGLTLAQIGIPDSDVLLVVTDCENRYIEIK